MNQKVRFFCSLVIILIVSWGDVFFISMQHSLLPGILKQAIHTLALLITFFIGIYNWSRFQANWLVGLWQIMYGLFFIVLLFTSVLFFINANLLNQHYLNSVIALRNVFVGPLPFLVFYVLTVFL